MSSLLSVSALYKNYLQGGRTIEVLKGVALDFEEGTTTALVGASGAGKSTLLHILGALDRPTSGSVLHRGVDLFSRSDASLAEFRSKNVGFVFQFHHLLPEFSAIENVMMPAIVARRDRKTAENSALQLLEHVGLADRLSHRPGELSGGEQQRVAIARALVMEPELLLADEPTGNLDMKTSESIHQLLDEIQRQRGITLIIVTHNEQLAAGMGRIVRLDDGLTSGCLSEELCKQVCS